jgi:hypothetical protein
MRYYQRYTGNNEQKEAAVLFSDISPNIHIKSVNECSHMPASLMLVCVETSNGWRSEMSSYLIRPGSAGVSVSMRPTQRLSA